MVISFKILDFSELKLPGYYSLFPRNQNLLNFVHPLWMNDVVGAFFKSQ